VAEFFGYAAADTLQNDEMFYPDNAKQAIKPL